MFLFIWLLIFFNAVVAQQFPLRNYGMSDGLLHSTVYRVFQDQRGFLWFCTDYGLCCFDGKNFRKVNNDSLLLGPVISVSEDGNGHKLISSIKEGILLLSDSGVKKYSLLNNVELKYALYAVSKGHIIWGLTRGYGLSLFSIRSHQLRADTTRDEQRRKVNFTKISEYPDELLLASNNGVFRIRDSIVEPLFQHLVKGPISDVKRSRDGTYWISSDTKLLGIKDQRIIYSFEFKSWQHIGNILCDRDNRVWVALYSDGLFLLHDGRMEEITTRLAMHRTFINDLYQDNEGNIWLATYDAGVYKISTLDLLNYFLENEQLSIFCKALAPWGKDRLIMGTLGRLYIWENSKIRQLPFRSLRVDEYIYFVKVSGNTLYVGTPHALYTKDLSSPAIPEKAIVPHIAGAVSMCIDHRNKKWIGGYQHLYCMDAGNRITIDSSSEMIHRKRFNALFEDSRHCLWLGTTNGLVTYYHGRFSRFNIYENKAFSIINNIYEDSRDRVWVATEGGLLCIEGGHYKKFTTKNGLTSNKCHSLVEDGNNTLWVATLNGLSYIDLTTLEIKGYGAGIYPNEALCLYFNKNDLLFVGTATGLSSIKTNRIVMDDKPPAVYITGVNTENGHVNMPSGVSLPYHANKLSIDFIGLSFQNVNDIEYRYKIKNLHDEWVFTTNNSLELPSLPSGNYCFILNARKNKGKWSKEVVLPIVISTPFWKAWWFILLLAAVAFGFIFLLTRWRIKKYESKKREWLNFVNKELSLHNKITYLKQQALSALINPHFIFNCMNSIQHYLNRYDNDKANAYLADFAHLIRITMQGAQQAFIDLNEEMQRIKLYLSLEQLRFGDHLTYEIRIMEGLDPSGIRIPNMILQPYIENAIWHGIMPNEGIGNISILLAEHRPGELKITIDDNGVGIQQSRRLKNRSGKEHFGMALTAERLKLLKQLSKQNYNVAVEELSDESGKSRGTRIEILLPFFPMETDSVQS
jgi:ligand-binding sensor domain-containing protein